LFLYLFELVSGLVNIDRLFFAPLAFDLSLREALWLFLFITFSSIFVLVVIWVLKLL
jgi:hypothetical protein